MAHFEGYYASVFHASFAAAGLDVRAEDATSHGRPDMAVRLGERVFLLEFKVSEAVPQGSALAQLKARVCGLRNSSESGLSCERGVSRSETPSASRPLGERRGYADKYRRDGKRILLIGVEFSRERRNLTAFDVELA